MSLIQQWGNAAWILIHVLCEKLKSEECSIQNIYELRDVLFVICYNLPCPICSKHARDNLIIVNIREINSKERIIDFFYQFHNLVNSQLQKPIQSRENVLIQYKQYRTIDVVTNFINVFRRMNQSNFRMMAVLIQNNMAVDKLINFLNNKNYIFNA